MAGEDSPLLQPEASAGPRRLCKFAVLTALALGAVGAVASSRVQGRHVVEGPPAALFEDFAPPSDSSDVFGCGCTIGWCCKNKDLFDHAFATKQDDESSTFLGTTPCALWIAGAKIRGRESPRCGSRLEGSAGRDDVASTRVRRFQTVIGNAGWHFDPHLSKDTICTLDASKRPRFVRPTVAATPRPRRVARDGRLLAGAEVDAGKRDGSLSVCDPAAR